MVGSLVTPPAIRHSGRLTSVQSRDHLCPSGQSPGTPTIPDYLAGVMGAFGALAAIQHRHRTGEGQVVDVALYEPLLRMLDELLPAYGGEGHVRERIGSGTEYVVPHNHYRTRDGRWIAIACTNDRMFERLVTGAMKRPELLADFGSVAARLRRRGEVDDLVQAWVAGQDAAEAFYRIVDAAYERRSIAVTSNIHPSGFDTIMPKTLATATVDRLLHHAHLVLTKGDSHRLAEALAGKGVTPLA